MTTDNREQMILGEPLRIDPLKVDEINEDLLAIVLSMISVNEAIDARGREELTDLVTEDTNGDITFSAGADLSEVPEIIRTMLRHPELFSRHIHVGLQLLGKGVLAARDRELAILRIGWLCRAPFEWGEHVQVAKKVGITSDEIERVTQGSSADGWSERDAAIIKATEELHADAMISNDTWAVLEKYLDTQQLIELPIVVGQYQTVAYYQNSLRIRLHEGNDGLKAR